MQVNKFVLKKRLIAIILISVTFVIFILNIFFTSDPQMIYTTIFLFVMGIAFGLIISIFRENSLGYKVIIVQTYIVLIFYIILVGMQIYNWLNHGEIIEHVFYIPGLIIIPLYKLSGDMEEDG